MSTASIHGECVDCASYNDNLLEVATLGDWMLNIHGEYIDCASYNDNCLKAATQGNWVSNANN